MFKAVKDITFGTTVIAAGEEVQKPTLRMIELGLVEEVQGESVDTAEVAKTEKPKKEKQEKKVKEVKEEVKETTDTEEVKEELLTEDSADITVEKTDEAQ